MRRSIQHLVDEHGEITSVDLLIAEYLELLEYLAILAAVAERRDEPMISHCAFVAEVEL